MFINRQKIDFSTLEDYVFLFGPEFGPELFDNVQATKNKRAVTVTRVDADTNTIYTAPPKELNA